MAYTKTPTLGIDVVPWAGQGLNSYPDTLELEQQLSASFAVIDTLAGLVTGSFSEEFYMRGSLTASANGFFHDGMRHATTDRVITSVGVAYQSTQDPGNNSVAVFSLFTFLSSSSGLALEDKFTSAASPLKPHISASVHANFIVRYFTPTRPAWPAGYLLGMSATGTISGAFAPTDVSVFVTWRPSASFYGTGLV